MQYENVLSQKAINNKNANTLQ